MLGYLGTAQSLCGKCLDLIDWDGCLPTLVDTRLLGLGHALKLPLLPEAGFELSESPKHVKEALARGGAGVDWLLKASQGRTLERRP